jgi:hypothetical protein
MSKLVIFITALLVTAIVIYFRDVYKDTIEDNTSVNRQMSALLTDSIVDNDLIPWMIPTYYKFGVRDIGYPDSISKLSQPTGGVQSFDRTNVFLEFNARLEENLEWVVYRRTDMDEEFKEMKNAEITDKGVIDRDNPCVMLVEILKTFNVCDNPIYVIGCLLQKDEAIKPKDLVKFLNTNKNNWLKVRKMLGENNCICVGSLPQSPTLHSRSINTKGYPWFVNTYYAIKYTDKIKEYISPISDPLEVMSDKGNELKISLMSLGTIGYTTELYRWTDDDTTKKMIKSYGPEITGIQFYTDTDNPYKNLDSLVSCQMALGEDKTCNTNTNTKTPKDGIVSWVKEKISGKSHMPWAVTTYYRFTLYNKGFDDSKGTTSSVIRVGASSQSTWPTFHLTNFESTKHKVKTERKLDYGGSWIDISNDMIIDELKNSLTDIDNPFSQIFALALENTDIKSCLENIVKMVFFMRAFPGMTYSRILNMVEDKDHTRELKLLYSKMWGQDSACSSK